MGKIISFANQKGGVGKTTSAINLAAGLGLRGYKVLVVDIDPQGNATSGLGVNKREYPISTYNLMVTGASLNEVRVQTAYKNLDILPSNINLAGVEIELVELSERSYRLKQALAAAKAEYDYIIIDCPPSLGLITINAFSASDTILVPLQCEYYAMEGVSQLIATVRQVKRMYNPDIAIEGILLTMYDTRLNLTVQVASEVKQYFGDKVYKTVIPRNVRLSEAPSYGKPIQYYDSLSKGAESYTDLTSEFIKCQKRGGKNG